MKNFKRMIGTALAVGLAMIVFGCGGSGFLSESPTEVSSEGSNPVHITFGAEAESGMIGTTDANKDAGGIGIIDMGPGDVQSPAGEWYQIIPVIADLANSGGYEVAVNEDPANPSAGIRCDYAYLSGYMDELLVECSGILPEGAEGTDLTGSVRMNHYLRTLQADGTDAAIRINGLNPGFSELNASVTGQITEAAQWDVTENLYGPSSELDKYDRYGCNGLPTSGGEIPMEMDFSAAGDPWIPVLGGTIDAADGESFTKGIGIDADMGDLFTDPFGIEAYRCHFQTIKPFAIEIVFDADLDRDKYKECGLFVNDVNLPSENFCNALSMDASAVQFADGSPALLSPGATNVQIHRMLTSFAANVDPNTINATNHLLTITTDPLPAGISSANVDTWDYTLTDDLSGDGLDDDYAYNITDAYKFEQLSFEDVWVNVKDVNGATYDGAVTIDYTASWSVSHDWNVSTFASGNEVHNLGLAATARFPSTVADWATARTYVSLDAANSEMDVIEGAADQVLALSNTMEINNANRFRVEVAFTNISGIDDVSGGPPSTSGDAILVEVTDSVTNYSYAMGLEAYDDSNGVQMYCVAYQWSNASGSWIIDNGSQVNCNAATDVIFRIDYQNDLDVAAVYFSLDNGQNFTDMNTGALHYAASGNPKVTLGDIDLGLNDIVVSMLFASNVDTFADNVVSVDSIRLFGLTNADGGWTMFKDLQVHELTDFLTGR
jgi:hypothetical protein